MSPRKTAVISGVNGQSGPYLASLLIEKGYHVYGLVRDSSNDGSTNFINDFSLDNSSLSIIKGDITDESTLFKLLELKPDEFYNLAAFSHPGTSFSQPDATLEVNGKSVLNILELIRKLSPKTKLCQIGTSDMFAGSLESPQNENTNMIPVSPYGASKLFAYNMVKIYRQAYDIYGTNIIAYGHDSPRRSNRFVTKKIVEYAVKYSLGLVKTQLPLGNLDSLRDWGDVPSYVEGMYLSLQQDKPNDYILATGKQHSIKDLCILAFKEAGINLKFVGEGMDCKGIDIDKNQQIIFVDKDFYRPIEPVNLVGNPEKAYNVLGWKSKMGFEEVVRWMVKEEKNRVKNVYT
jgi:GDPmannose 4,6-dehydratase